MAKRTTVAEDIHKNIRGQDRRLASGNPSAVRRRAHTRWQRALDGASAQNSVARNENLMLGHIKDSAKPASDKRFAEAQTKAKDAISSMKRNLSIETRAHTKEGAKQIDRRVANVQNARIAKSTGLPRPVANVVGTVKRHPGKVGLALAAAAIVGNALASKAKAAEAPSAPSTTADRSEAARKGWETRRAGGKS